MRTHADLSGSSHAHSFVRRAHVYETHQGFHGHLGPPNRALAGEFGFDRASRRDFWAAGAEWRGEDDDQIDSGADFSDIRKRARARYGSARHRGEAKDRLSAGGIVPAPIFKRGRDAGFLRAAVRSAARRAAQARRGVDRARRFEARAQTAAARIFEGDGAARGAGAVFDQRSGIYFARRTDEWDGPDRVA